MWSRVLWPGRYGAMGHVVEGYVANGTLPRVKWPMFKETTVFGWGDMDEWSRVIWPGRYGAMGHVVEGSLAGEIWSYGLCGRGFFGQGDMELWVMWSRVIWPGRYGAIGHVVEGFLARGGGGMELWVMWQRVM